jgi:hypothetical protein
MFLFTFFGCLKCDAVPIGIFFQTFCVLAIFCSVFCPVAARVSLTLPVLTLRHIKSATKIGKKIPGMEAGHIPL